MRQTGTWMVQGTHWQQRTMWVQGVSTQTLQGTHTRTVFMGTQQQHGSQQQLLRWWPHFLKKPWRAGTWQHS
jgi:hypothetical protein